MSYFTFKLSPAFIEPYKTRRVEWGFEDAGGNSLGELTFVRTYSRIKPDGSKERWWEVCERVINGMYTIQKNHAKRNGLPWLDRKAQKSAQEAYERMFTFKWTPPGRGMWVMGTDFVMKDENGAALQNCSFISTGDIDKSDPGEVFSNVFEQLMFGIGVGWDTRGKYKNIVVQRPLEEKVSHVIPDSREGWSESIRLLINSYLKPNQKRIVFDYGQIRPYGEPIKGFGGVASGPEPLARLHNKLSEIFEAETGCLLGSRLIADIMNLIGTCVVAGNVRRSAEIGLGEPDDFDFINLKNAEVFPERNSYDPSNPGWAWMSNNSLDVKVGQDYDPFVERIVSNGEPGFAWMDVTRQFGRLGDAPDFKDHRAAGFNPSLIPGTKVYTTDGIVPIEELEGKKFFVRNLDGKISEATCWKSGENEEVLSVRLRGGIEYGATPKHEWPVWNGSGWAKKKTSELRPGDKLKNLVTKSVFPNGTRGTYEEGFAIGWNLGDGWQTTREKGMQIGFMVSEQDRASGIDNILNKFLSSLGSNSTFDGKDELNVNNSALRTLFIEYGVKHKSEGLPASVWDSEFSDDYRKGIVDGLLSSDGSVDPSAKRICFTQKSEKLVDELMELLGFFGVKTSKERRTTTSSVSFPGHPAYADGEKIFTSFVMKISSLENLKTFNDCFTLSRKDKQQHIIDIVNSARKTGAPTNWFVEVVSVEPMGTSDVWDVSVYDTTHAFQLAHCITGNCAEQPLESRECCTLVEVHLNRAESREDFLRTLKFAYLYGKTVTLMKTHWPKTNAVMQRNRRIGTSTTGIVNFLETRGLPELREWWDAGYKKISYYDNKYSEWLGVRESIRTTTVKPSGSVSLLSGATPGVHWPPAGPYYLRAMRLSADNSLVEPLRRAGYTVEDDLVSANSVVVYFPIKTEVARSEKDVSIFEKIHLASEAQQYWSDNSVSVTVSFNKDTESAYVGKVLSMYEGKLKTVSFLPMGNDVYPQQPYTSISQEQYESYIGVLDEVDMSVLYGGNVEEAIGERGCVNDVCEIKVETGN